MFCEEDNHWWFVSKRKFIEKVLPSPNQKLNILDIGCGTGGTSLFLEKWGKVKGVEKSKAAYPYLKRRKIKFIRKSIDNYKIPPDKYNLICLFDVLYHKGIPGDSKILKKVYDALPSGGLVCITDCAIPYLFGFHDITMHARERYFLQNLNNKTENAGFTIIRSSYTFFLLFPLFLVSRLLNKVIPYTTISRPPKLINEILSCICEIEAQFLKFISFPIGSSVIILAKKS